MLHTLATNISFYFVKKGLAEIERQEVYAYGLEIFFSTMLNIIFVIIAAFFLGRFIETVAFLIAFIIMRKTAGGYHASTHFSCILVFFATYMLNMKVLGGILANNIGDYAIAISLIATLLLYIVGPVDHENKRFSVNEFYIFKKKSRRIGIYQCILVFIGVLVFHECINIWVSMSLGAITVALSAAVARLIKKNGESKNVKKDVL